METLPKQTEENIALSVALVTSFVISSFEKYTAAIPPVRRANVAGANTKNAQSHQLPFVLN